MEGRDARYAAKKHNDSDVGLGLMWSKGKKAISGCRSWNRDQWRWPTAYDLQVESVCAALYKNTTISASGWLLMWRPKFLSVVTTPGVQCFFFPVKIKSARETYFWHFFDFFHGQFSFFTPTFWPIFQIFHAHFYFFHGQFFRFFHGKKITFHGQKI